MAHRVYRSDDGLLCMAIDGPVSSAETAEIRDRLLVALGDGGPPLLLIDQSRAELAFSREARREMQTAAELLTWERAAIFGMSNFNRMIGRVVLALAGKTESTQFFATEGEARAWLLSARDASRPSSGAG
ncbi:STAS/SEC14 domain-containing protein [Plesiocystis pacifica]|nr:STAS/SEC14 domain-containing protein [Plesiocystis pacifica]